MQAKLIQNAPAAVAMIVLHWGVVGCLTFRTFYIVQVFFKGHIINDWKKSKTKNGRGGHMKLYEQSLKFTMLEKTVL